MSSTSVTVVVPQDASRKQAGRADATRAIEKYLETTGFTFEVLTPGGDALGAALRRGVSDAKGRVIVLADADLPYPVSAIGDAVAMVESGATDVVFASARADDHGPALLRWLLVPMLPDRAIRLAAFTSAAAKIVVGESRLHDDACALEFAFLANKYGFRVEPLVVQSSARRRSFGILSAISIRLTNRR
ncbi:MAG TPA: glycosyltransferase, partial [Thermoanaerobaculia bacterium]|nr:glycosyltransferase [Thermoanaerobaculia bacterium]